MGDNPMASSGYGQVWNNLLSRWAKSKPDWEFFHVGWQNHDRPHKTIDGYTMLPIAKAEYGFDTVTRNLMEIKPDILVTLADVGWQAGFIDGIMEARKRGWRGKWVAYTPVDTQSWEPVMWSKILDVPNINVAMSESGRRLFSEHDIKHLHYIPHGVDLDIYCPLDNKEEIRTKYKINNKFVIGFVGRNQRRKQISQLIRGFAQFSKDKPDVKLLLHTDANSPQHSLPGWNIQSLVEKYSREHDDKLVSERKVMFTRENLDIIARQSIQPKDMNDIYNLMDVFCFSTGGEGFGLPAIECQSSGVPLLMTAYTTGFELCGEHGLLIPILEDKYERDVTEVGTNSIENAVPDDKAIASLLNMLYEDWKAGGEKLKEMSIKSREHATKYNWDNIANKWIELFENEK